MIEAIGVIAAVIEVEIAAMIAEMIIAETIATGAREAKEARTKAREARTKAREERTKAKAKARARMIAVAVVEATKWYHQSSAWLCRLAVPSWLV